MSDSADEPWHPQGWTGMIWRHQQQQTQKNLFPHLVLQRRCILVRVPHGVKDVTVSGVWTVSRVKLFNSLPEDPLIHTDVPTCSDRPKPLTDNSSETVCDEFMAQNTICTELNFKQHQHFLTYFTVANAVITTIHGVIKRFRWTKSLNKRVFSTQLGIPGSVLMAVFSL